VNQRGRFEAWAAPPPGRTRGRAVLRPPRNAMAPQGVTVTALQTPGTTGIAGTRHPPRQVSGRRRRVSTPA
jgi:hypothetical protein